MLKIFNKILEIVSTRRKVTFLIFIFLTIICSFLDAISIGLIIPFIALFLDYNKTVIAVSKFNFLDLGGINKNTTDGIIKFKDGVGGSRYELVGEYINMFI